MLILTVVNLFVFLLYIYTVRNRLGLIEAYSFNWFFAFLSFEFFPFYLEVDLSESVRILYYSFFITCSSFLVILSVIKVRKIPNPTSLFVSDKDLDNEDFLRWSFWLCLIIVTFALLHRYHSGSLVLGVDYQNNSSIVSSIMNYILMLFGYNHTGYWFYMGLLSISFAMGSFRRKYNYFIFSLLYMTVISAITTQKTYFLFSAISLFVFFTYKNRSVIKQIIFGLLASFGSVLLILILNNIRYVKKEGEGSVFDYFDLETAIWYMSLRLDYASSSLEIINNGFISFSEYILELAKSFLFFIPKSILFQGDMYGVKIAQLISYSENSKAGLSFLPYAHFYQMGGVFATITLAVIMAVIYKYYSNIINNSRLGLVYYIYMIPFVYYTSLTAPLHENIYTLLRSSFSFLLFFVLCKITFSLIQKFRKVM